MKRGILEWISIGLVIIGMGAGIYSAVDNRIDDLSVKAAVLEQQVKEQAYELRRLNRK